MTTAKPEPMLTIDVDNKIRLSGDIRPEVLKDLKQSLTMDNPAFTKQQRLGYNTHGIPRQLTFYEEEDSRIVIPRGYTRQLIELLLKHRCFFIVDSNPLRSLPHVSFNFNAKLWEHQKNASAKVLARKFGVASMPTGSGKTVLALYCIAQRKQPALVIVDKKTLLYQWRDEAKKYLGLSKDELGLMGDGKKKIGSKLTIAIINTLRKNITAVKDKIGFLIVDECHRVPSTTFSSAVSEFDTKFMLGLSATPRREDGLTRLIYLHLGDLTASTEDKELEAKGVIIQPVVLARQTNRSYAYNNDYPAMITAIINDTERNNKIVKDVLQFSVHSMGTALVVSDRKEHCNELSELIAAKGFTTGLLTGSTPPKKREEIIQAANEGAVDVLVATTQLIGEGFNCKKLTGLFICTPFRASTKLEQLIGRVRRMETGKETPTIYDYVDNHGLLQASYRRRHETYRRMGLEFI